MIILAILGILYAMSCVVWFAIHASEALHYKDPDDAAMALITPIWPIVVLYRLVQLVKSDQN